MQVQRVVQRAVRGGARGGGGEAVDDRDRLEGHMIDMIDIMYTV